MSERMTSHAERMEHLSKMPDGEKKQVLTELALCRERLHELSRQADKFGYELPKKLPQVTISLSLEDHEELQRIAAQASTSLAALAQLGVRHVILQARSGALPMMAPAKVETAQAVDSLGRPLV